MSTLYSTRFMNGTLPSGGGTATSDPVPTGFVWVLKCVTASMEGNPNGYFFVQGPGGITVAYWNMYQQFANVNFETMVVYNAGETIGLQAIDTASGVDYTVNGYQLSAT